MATGKIGSYRRIRKKFIIVMLFSLVRGVLGASENRYCGDYIKIWGEIKYYTSFIADFIPNLDSAFQTDIKSILERNTRVGFNQAVTALISYTDRHSIEHTSGVEIENAEIQNDTICNWILKCRSLSVANRRFLMSLTNRPRSSACPFFVFDPESNAGLMVNEKRFISAYPTREIRLLALARYWNAIHFFYPHKDLLLVDWNSILDSYVGKLIKCRDEYEYHTTILQLICLTRDAHGSVYSYTLEKHAGFCQLPFSVEFFNNDLYITGIINNHGHSPFLTGDKIVSINNETFEDYYSGVQGGVWGTNPKRMRNIAAKDFIRATTTAARTIKLVRNDSVIEISTPGIEMGSIKPEDRTSFRNTPPFIVGSNYIYLDINRIDSLDFVKMLVSSNKPNIIIDIRKYPNWIKNQIADLFCNDSVEFAKYQHPDNSRPGRFSLPKPLYLIPGINARKVSYKRIFVMVNCSTVSRGEFLCMAFQALPNVLTVGDHTAGADGNITKVLLPGNISTAYTGLNILYPDGSATQQKGVKIDIFFKSTGAGIAACRDEELDFILEKILKNGADN